MSQLLESRFSICKNPKSFNSQIGVPVSVWNLKDSSNLGIFEAGISRPGEMEVLASVIQPTLGILTNLGSAHREGFQSEEEKYHEKLLLFRNASRLVLPEEFLLHHRALIREVLPHTELLPWSWKKISDGIFQLSFAGNSPEFRLPFRDQASLENLGNSISMALLLGLSAQEISQGLVSLNQPEMRLSIKAGRYENILVDDSYTNEPNGLEAALQFANLQRREGQAMVMILSDLEGFSGDPPLLQELIESKVSSHSVSQLITVGNQMAGLSLQLPGGHQHFLNLKMLMRELSIADFHSSVILVKGARRFGMEKLVQAWQEKVHGTYLEINLDSLIHNLNFYRSGLPSRTRTMAMVKALGYGSGEAEIARLLEFHKVDYLAVAYADEGVRLREAGIRMPIMVMNPTPDAMDAVFQFKLEPEIYSFRMLEAFESTRKSGRHKNTPSIHIKVDTGMHRLGFMPEECGMLSGKLQQSGVKVATVFSHLVGADDPALSEFSLQQIDRFRIFCSDLQANGIDGFSRHILNSAGILRFPEAAFEMVRLGIGLYGIEANGELQTQLKPVSRLKTIISQIKTLPAGSSVGYGRREFLQKESRVATIAIGYSDGFRRAFSAGAVKLRWNDLAFPVLGNVCMDMAMIDISGSSLQEGDEITIFETAEDVFMLARAANTIPYEILTGIGHRVKRIFFRE